MRVLIINSVCGICSTGRICTDIADQLTRQGNEVRIAYGRKTVPEKYLKYAVRIGSTWDNWIHGLYTRVFDAQGFGSRTATSRFLKWADEYDPELLWLHNLHGYYLNIEMLFKWIKSRPEMQILWTLHDCWSFTGHCTNFALAKCEKWKTCCKECVQKRSYPSCYFFDHSKTNYIQKKNLFTGVKEMTLIVPSHWLEDLVKQSFLKDYPIELRYNTIDASVFKPTPSNFRMRYGLQNKKIILGVANEWSARKGFFDFINLSKLLDHQYVIVLVGLCKKQIRTLPNNIIGLTHTDTAEELAEIYTAADVFFNPTYEDNFPTVNLEAEACGTRVITYRTGGAPETIKCKNSAVIDVGDINGFIEYLSRL